MSLHSHSRVWLHLVWGTKNRQKILTTSAAVEVSQFLKMYAGKERVYMSTNYVNPDHVHTLIDLPVHLSVADLVKRLKGASSHWINHHNLIEPQFSWGRGYGVFSVSHSHREKVVQYISNQREHHKVKTFAEEYREFVERHGLQWHLDA